LEENRQLGICEVLHRICYWWLGDSLKDMHNFFAIFLFYALSSELVLS